MDNSLEHLETELENLIPRSLSNGGRERCHSLIDELVSTSQPGKIVASRDFLGTMTAAVAALAMGVGGGWYLGNDRSDSSSGEGVVAMVGSSGEAFDQIDLEAWLLTEDSPDVYVTRSGEIREISREVELTKEVVQHRESGVLVTVETTDHHVVDSVKSEF